VEETALHLAIRNGHPNAVALLVCAGADTNLAYKYGETRKPLEELIQVVQEQDQVCAQQLQTALKLSWPSADARAFLEASALSNLDTVIARGRESKAPPEVPVVAHFPHDDEDDDEDDDSEEE